MLGGVGFNYSQIVAIFRGHFFGGGRGIFNCQLKTERTSRLPLCSHLTKGNFPVTLRWRLHFEFVTAREPAEPPVVCQNESKETVWAGAENVEVDTFSWDLPIKILPTNPALASYESQFTGTNSINI